MIEIREVEPSEIEELSRVATEIVRKHYDPILGTKQNDYMLEKFQSVAAIREQLEHGYTYCFVRNEGKVAGFLGFYPAQGMMYLSKLYLYEEQRGQKIGRKMIEYLKERSRALGLSSIFLNVNKYNYESIAAYKAMGFVKIRDEVNDIGHGYVMDDYVFQLDF